MPSLLRTIETQFAGKLAKGVCKLQDDVPATPVDILDIRRDTVKANLKEEIHKLFRPRDGPRELPTLLLYDAKGLQLFEKVCPLLTSGHGPCHTDCAPDHISGGILLDQ